MKASGNWRLKGFQWLDKNYARLTRVFALLAGVFILAIEVISIREMIFRNLGMPSAWASELTELLILWVFLLPIAFTQLDGGMVRVTLLADKLPRRVQCWMKMLASFSSVLFGLLLFKASFGFYQSAVPGSYFPETNLPAALQRGVVPLCALLLAMAGVLCLIRDLLALFPGMVSSDTEK